MLYFILSMCVVLYLKFFLTFLSFIFCILKKKIICFEIPVNFIRLIFLNVFWFVQIPFGSIIKV